jgi:predicted amidophosphoribosyltransferase
VIQQFEKQAELGEVAQDSRAFAAQLRAGPLRSLIDKIVRSAAELTGMPFMVLGIRYDDYYEFISTHGIPLTHYSDRVPAHVLAPSLFSREVEVADLQSQAEFTALGIAPVAKTWRYGGNCPVRVPHALSDDGVLALSCADRLRHDTGGRTISILRQHAEFISDLLWLGNQVPRASIVANPLIIVKAVLQASVARFSLPVCIIDANRVVLGQSDSFTSTVRTLGGRRPEIGMPLDGAWLDTELRTIIDRAIATGQAKQWQRFKASAIKQYLDVFPFALSSLGTFAVVSFHEGENQPKRSATVPEARAASPASAMERSGPLARFLDETLVRSQRLYRRNETNYVGIRRWRSAIKPHQISALRALKSDLPDEFVIGVARELADAVRAVYGSPEACVVVPVPCGHSGNNCLSQRLGRALAEELGIKSVDAFEPIETAKGSSHPKKNSKRGSMRLKEPIDQPVILVDDVATSGSHIDEAATALRPHVSSVWPVAWIVN